VKRREKFTKTLGERASPFSPRFVIFVAQMDLACGFVIFVVQTGPAHGFVVFVVPRRNR